MTNTEKDDLVDNRLGYEREIINLKSRITELQAQLKEAREALKPFGDEAKVWTKQIDHHRPAAYCEAFSVGDLRRAARALTGTEAYAAAVNALETIKPRD